MVNSRIIGTYVLQLQGQFMVNITAHRTFELFFRLNMVVFYMLKFTKRAMQVRETCGQAETVRQVQAGLHRGGCSFPLRQGERQVGQRDRWTRRDSWTSVGQALSKQVSTEDDALLPFDEERQVKILLRVRSYPWSFFRGKIGQNYF